MLPLRVFLVLQKQILLTNGYGLLNPPIFFRSRRCKAVLQKGSLQEVQKVVWYSETILSLPHRRLPALSNDANLRNYDQRQVLDLHRFQHFAVIFPIRHIAHPFLLDWLQLHLPTHQNHCEICFPSNLYIDVDLLHNGYLQK